MCRICEEIKNNEFKLYEDNEICVFLSKWGIKGSCIIAPKQHYTILEQVPEEIFNKCFIMANKVAALIFDVLKCQGTNIVINNGDGANQSFSHFTINVIPRFENDNVIFDWPRNKANIEELKEIAFKLMPKENIDESKKSLKKEEVKKEINNNEYIKRKENKKEENKVKENKEENNNPENKKIDNDKNKINAETHIFRRIP